MADNFMPFGCVRLSTWELIGMTNIMIVNNLASLKKAPGAYLPSLPNMHFRIEICNGFQGSLGHVLLTQNRLSKKER